MPWDTPTDARERNTFTAEEADKLNALLRARKAADVKAYEVNPLSDTIDDFTQNALAKFNRDPGYEYGSVLPFRKKEGGQAEWGLGYSDLARGIYQAVTAPGRAVKGEEMGPSDAMNVALNMAGGGTFGRAPVNSLAMNVWHGSPHKFDKFDLSKVGTGEGNQMYGHGLYFAENPSVAQTYKEALSSPSLNGVPLEKHVSSTTGEAWAVDALINGGGSPREAKALLKDHTYRNGMYEKDSEKHTKEAMNLIDKWHSDGTLKKEGYIYHVDLPDEHIAEMLHWDQPFDKQPKNVQKAMKELNVYDFAKEKYGSANPTGRHLYHAATEMGYHPGEVSGEFSQSGIPGVKYADQFSRGKDNPTHNFVVFRDDLPKIIERIAGEIVE